MYCFILQACLTSDTIQDCLMSLLFVESVGGLNESSDVQADVEAYGHVPSLALAFKLVCICIEMTEFQVLRGRLRSVAQKLP